MIDDISTIDDFTRADLKNNSFAGNRARDNARRLRLYIIAPDQNEQKANRQRFFRLI
jgi:hypothetical protein